MLYIIIYIVGFILTLTFLKLFGKKLGIDYDTEITYADYDDWENNAQAYLAFSITWVVTAPMFIVVVLIKSLYKFTQWFLKYPNV
jgi:hypothetical protein